MIKDMIDKQVMELKKLWANKRQLAFQVLNLAMIVFSALMIWKGLMFLTKVCGSICVLKYRYDAWICLCDGLAREYDYSCILYMKHTHRTFNVL